MKNNEHIYGSHLIRQIAGYVEGLSEQDRLIISLFYYEDINSKQISQLMHKKLSEVENVLRICKLQLSKIIDST